MMGQPVLPEWGNSGVVMRSLQVFLIVLLISAAIAACIPTSPGTPLPDIPRMPGAWQESEVENGAEYLVESTLTEVEEFYVSRMQAAGWEYRGLGEGIGGLFLTFNKGNEILVISAYQARNETFVRVVLKAPPPTSETEGQG